MNNEDTPVDVQEIKTKVCPRCSVEKSYSDFSKIRKNGDKIRSICRQCNNLECKLYKLKNKEKIQDYDKKYKKENKEKLLITSKLDRIENKEKIQDYNKKYYALNKQEMNKICSEYKVNNKDVVNALNMKRHASKLSATPDWLTKEQLEEIKDFYTACQMFQMYTGLTYHVDHIVPLQGKNVCGLHVPWNLQILEASENLRKNNKLLEEFKNAIC